MNPQLSYLLAQQRIADLHRAAEHARLAIDAGTRRRGSRYSSPIVRALSMPTAHPSLEAWPVAGLPAGMSPTPARTSARPALHQYRTRALDGSSRCLSPSSLAMTHYGSTNHERSHGAAPNDNRPAHDLWWMTGRESGSMAFSQPQISSVAVERSEQLTRLVYELLDPHTDPEHLSRRPHSALLGRAHLGYLRDQQRVARETPAHAS